MREVILPFLFLVRCSIWLNLTLLSFSNIQWVSLPLNMYVTLTFPMCANKSILFIYLDYANKYKSLFVQILFCQGKNQQPIFPEHLLMNCQLMRGKCLNMVRMHPIHMSSASNWMSKSRAEIWEPKAYLHPNKAPVPTHCSSFLLFKCYLIHAI